jgi:hypothetical protein
MDIFVKIVIKNLENVPVTFFMPNSFHHLICMPKPIP